MWVPFAELFRIAPYDVERLTYNQFCALEQRAFQAMNRPEDSDG